MSDKEKIDIDLFKVVFRAMAQSDNLEVMANHLAQLLIAALDIKGCTIFALNPESDELEVLSSFGLSVNYIHKGPILSDKSIADTFNGKPIVIRDVNNSDLLQYPEDAKNEGIGAIVSVPINFYGRVIGALRLYHHQQWDISEKDVHSLLVLSESIGWGMSYSRVLKALKTVRFAIDDINGVWMKGPKGE